jgi:probable rRNA maturation factor
METELADRQQILPVDEQAVQRVVRAALAGRADAPGELSVVVVDDEHMSRLHRQYKHCDRTTDVLAFPYETGPAGPVVGEVVVNAEQAVREAAGRAHTAHDELLLYVAHGVLHLVGFDDQDDAGRRRMREREREVLRAAGCAAEF